ncbi:MAG: ligase-associated DNA damage response DEXH box helicase [Pseudomonadota bacterium]
MTGDAAATGPESLVDAWLRQRGWRAFGFQRNVWRAMAAGESGLLHATTGAGKTYAVWLGALQCFAAGPAGEPKRAPPLTVLWVTPMRALAADTAQALRAPVDEIGLGWQIGLRTGDTDSAERARQARRLPTALVTTPESLTLLLASDEARARFDGLRLVVVDEWHELLGNKRGVQLQLALARLRRWHPGLLVWGVSATLGNLRHAREVLLPPSAGGGRVVQGEEPQPLRIDTLLPPGTERFPWAGHLGLRMLPQVVEALASAGTSLVFTNTRSQAERWYQALLDARPDWAGALGLHHASLSREARDWVEAGLKQGALKAVVCTSSLDLGVDFLPVERVLQIGSAKGVARLLQRAGRSGHAPGRVSRITLVPTHALELAEAAAARDAVAAGRVEGRCSPEKPLDVLVQHLVSMALGGGFAADALRAEVQGAWAYRDLTDDEWAWALAFVRHGGPSLGQYPDYRRAEPDEHGVWRVPSAALAKRHRMNIGTIVSEASVELRFWSRGGGGASLGTVEEGFIARLKPGDVFTFAGRVLELVRVEQMTAYVQRAASAQAAVPRWNGGRMPLSNELADAVVTRLGEAAHGRLDGPEMQALAPLLAVQQAWSALPEPGVLLAEALHSREGSHLFLYPFAGRNVHLGLASLLAWRVSRHRPVSFSIAVNDYGFELLSATEIDWADQLDTALFDDRQLLHDVLASLNASELARRRFREIARIAGLVFGGHPGQPKSARQLQASSALFFDVFHQHDPGNLLLGQARQEVLRQELDVDALARTLQRLRADRLLLKVVHKPTPLAFPLLVERFRERLGSEKLADRIARLLGELERAAGPGAWQPEAPPEVEPPPAASPRRRRPTKRGLPRGGEGG